MKISIAKKIEVDFRELAGWILERAEPMDIAEHIADVNDLDYIYAPIIENQMDENPDEFWDSLYKAMIEYCKEQF